MYDGGDIVPQFAHSREVDENSLTFVQPTFTFTTLAGNGEGIALVQNDGLREQQEQDERGAEHIEHTADVPPNMETLGADEGNRGDRAEPCAHCNDEPQIQHRAWLSASKQEQCAE